MFPKIHASLWLLSLGLLLFVAGCKPSAEPATEPSTTAAPATGTVSFEFVFGPDESESVSIEMEDGQTICDVMKKIEQPKISITGSGDMAFVQSIGTLETAGGEGWSYSVNGQWADRSIGVYPLQPGDEIKWTHGGFGTIE